MTLFEHFEQHHKIGPEARAALQALVQEVSCEKNEIVQAPGSRCRNIYLVKSGCARIFYYKDETDITEHFAFENELIVRAESLFTGQATTKGIQVLAPSVLYSIPAAPLFALYDQHHEIERLFRILIEAAYVATIKRLESLQFKSARERYLELLQNPQLVQNIPLKYLASYLGITQVSLSRIRADIR